MHAYDPRFDRHRNKKQRDYAAAAVRDPKKFLDAVVTGVAERMAPNAADAARAQAEAQAAVERRRNHQIINGLVGASVIIGAAALYYRFAK